MPRTCRYFTRRHTRSGPTNLSVMSHMSCGHTWKKVTTRSARHRWKTKTRILDICLRCLQRTSSRVVLRMAALTKMTLSSAISTLARISSLGTSSVSTRSLSFIVRELRLYRRLKNRLLGKRSTDSQVIGYWNLTSFQRTTLKLNKVFNLPKGPFKIQLIKQLSQQGTPWQISSPTSEWTEAQLFVGIISREEGALTGESLSSCAPLFYIWEGTGWSLDSLCDYLPNTYHCYHHYSSGKNDKDWTTGHMTERSWTARRWEHRF